MNKKTQELETRNIMQGMEEFATFMSFQSNYSGLRIISVESAVPEEQPPAPTKKAQVLPMKRRQPKINNEEPPQALHKSLSF